MTPADILDRAADIIDEYGHCRMAYYFRDRACALGALARADHGRTPVGLELSGEPYIRALQAAIWPPCIAAWNDDPQITAAEITSTMRATATVLRAQANREPVRESVTA